MFQSSCNLTWSLKIDYSLKFKFLFTILYEFDEFIIIQHCERLKNSDSLSFNAPSYWWEDTLD